MVDLAGVMLIIGRDIVSSGNRGNLIGGQVWVSFGTLWHSSGTVWHSKSRESTGWVTEYGTKSGIDSSMIMTNDLEPIASTRTLEDTSCFSLSLFPFSLTHH